jgi:hypothetical protein
MDPEMKAAKNAHFRLLHAGGDIAARCPYRLKLEI